MARTTNYDNRRVSLSIYSSSFNYYSDAEQLAPTTLNGDQGGFVCAGIVKLCQSVLVFLLSDDLIFDSTWGSAIPRYMSGSVQYFAQNIENVMSAAFTETKREMQHYQRDDAPADEQLSDLSLLSWDLMPDGTGITMTIQVTSVAGEQRNVVVPLNITV